MPSLSSIPWFAAGIMAIVLGVFVFLYRGDEATIVTLNSQIAVQNAAITNYKKLSAAAQARLKTAQAASAVRAAKDQQSIADLLARPLAPADEACKAADTEILEFTK